MNETPTSGPGPDSGLVVGGRYRLELLLGEGGFASVYRARHLQIPSLRVAVKLLRREHATKPDVVKRFYGEAHTAAALRNPHTVRIMDVGESDDHRPYIVMEYVDGASLDRVLARCRTLRTVSVARLASGILRALDEAHALGVIHRDMKPGNVMVVKERGAPHPIARVLDFGIAKVLEDAAAGLAASKSTMGGQVFCTPQYAAPEILRGEACFQSDLYALGHMMAEMLIGRPPYSRGNHFEIAAQQLAATPVPLPDPVLRSPLGDIVARAVQKDVEKRFESATAMLHALDETWTRLQAKPAPPRPKPVAKPIVSLEPEPLALEPVDLEPVEAAASTPAEDEPPQSPRTIGALARELLEGDSDEVAGVPSPASTMPIGIARETAPHQAIDQEAVVHELRNPVVATAKPAATGSAAVVELRNPVVAAAAPAVSEPAKPRPEPTAKPEDAPPVRPVAAPKTTAQQAPPSGPVVKPRAPAAAVSSARPPQQRLTATGMAPVSGSAATVQLNLADPCDEGSGMYRAVRGGRGAAIALGLLVLAGAAGAVLIATGVIGPRTARTAVAVSAAAAAVHASAAVPDAHRFTFSSSVEGAEAWYGDEKVGALPLFDVFGPAERPVQVRFTHPTFRGSTVEFEGAGPVVHRAQFQSP